MAFPSTLSSFNRPNPTDRLNSPSHSALHNTVSSAVGQLEAVIGVDGSNSVLGTVIGDLRSPGSGGGGHIQSANKGGTGQTTFTKGDILIASSSSVLTKLSVPATQKYALIVDSTQPTGLNWGIPGGSPIIRVYTSILTIWSKPSTLSYIVVEVVGGGGGGSDGSSNNGGSGGGAGGYARKVISASSLASAVSVMAASGGIRGGNGFLSFFGSILQATPGNSGGSNSGGSPGIGSIITLGSSTGEVMSSGQGGGPGISGTGTWVGGVGGNSFYGGGGPGGSNSAGAGAGASYGGGGGGGGSTGNTAGATGGNGVVIVSEY